MREKREQNHNDALKIDYWRKRHSLVLYAVHIIDRDFT